MPNWEEYYGTYDPDELDRRFHEDCINASRAEDEEYERLQRSFLESNGDPAKLNKSNVQNNNDIDLSEEDNEEIPF